MRRRYLIYIIFFVIALSACKKENNDASLIFESLNSFDEIELKSAFDVYLSQDSFYSVRVQGNEKMIENISVVVENQVLKIKNNNHLKWLRPKSNKISIYISSDRPKKVTAFETCNVRTMNPIITHEFGIIMGSKMNLADLELNNDVFYFWNIHPCGGKLKLRGRTNALKLWNFAIMSVDAMNLQADTGYVDNHSKGDCTINISDLLIYSIYGEGNIKLYGNPGQIILQENNSSGQLIKMN